MGIAWAVQRQSETLRVSQLVFAGEADVKNHIDDQELQDHLTEAAQSRWRHVQRVCALWVAGSGHRPGASREIRSGPVFPRLPRGVQSLSRFSWASHTHVDFSVKPGPVSPAPRAAHYEVPGSNPAPEGRKLPSPAASSGACWSSAVPYRCRCQLSQTRCSPGCPPGWPPLLFILPLLACAVVGDLWMARADTAA